MRCVETELPGVLILEPQIFRDPRGFFLESYHLGKMSALGIPNSFVQDNHSRSVRGTVRGLHYQIGKPQAKLCRVVFGAVLDVVVDLRRGSPTFGRHVSVELSAENARMIFVPRGFAHGFAVLSESADFLYKCDEFYHGPADRGVVWNDPDLQVHWPFHEPLLSEKDARLPRLAEVPADELPVWG